MASRKEPATQAHDGENNADNESSSARTDGEQSRSSQGELSMEEREWAVQALAQIGVHYDTERERIILPRPEHMRGVRSRTHCGVFEPFQFYSEEACHMHGGQCNFVPDTNSGTAVAAP